MITSSWRYLRVIAPFSLAAIAYVLLNARKLNVILLGGEEARQLGVNVSRLRISLLISLSLLTALTVAFNGIIGFIGLVSPHIARLAVGEDPRLLLPLSMLTGAWLLLAADIVARILIAPAELPVGAITSLIGIPFFLHLLIRRRYRS